MLWRSKEKTPQFDFSSLVHGKRLPILTLDERWLQLFPEESMPENIRQLRDNLNNLLKKQGKLMEDIKGLKRYKSQLMQEIVENMEVDETPLGKLKAKKLSKNQKLLLEAREKLEQAEHELDNIPNEIESANEALMVESSGICYEQMKKNYETSKQLEEEIAQLRDTLKQKILEKQDCETDNTMMYSYMHDIYGVEIMELLDVGYKKKEKEEKEEKKEE